MDLVALGALRADPCGLDDPDSEAAYSVAAAVRLHQREARVRPVGMWLDCEHGQREVYSCDGSPCPLPFGGSDVNLTMLFRGFDGGVVTLAKLHAAGDAPARPPGSPRLG